LKPHGDLLHEPATRHDATQPHPRWRATQLQPSRVHNAEILATSASALPRWQRRARYITPQRGEQHTSSRSPGRPPRAESPCASQTAPSSRKELARAAMPLHVGPPAACVNISGGRRRRLRLHQRRPSGSGTCARCRHRSADAGVGDGPNCCSTHSDDTATARS
jgi:hypothetical protein